MSKFFCLHLGASQAPVQLPGLNAIDGKRGVRVVKDVLRVGRWKYGTDRATGEPKFWDVTEDALKQLANNFPKMLANGVKPKLYWGNADKIAAGQHEVNDPRDTIAEIDQVILHDGVLYASSYVTPDQAKKLQNAPLEVSVKAQEDWMDGEGRKYDLALLHVAIVDQPVVTKQGPFFTLSNESPAEGNADMTLFEKLKAKYGFGDEVTVENIDAAIEAKLKPAVAETKLTDVSDDGKNLALVVKQQNKIIAEQGEQIKTLANSVTKMLAKEETSAKDAYNTKLDKLFKDGRINAAKKTELAKFGPLTQFNLSLLSCFDDVKTLANDGTRTKELANGEEPDLGGGETDAERNARLKAGGYEPLKLM